MERNWGWDPENILTTEPDMKKNNRREVNEETETKETLDRNKAKFNSSSSADSGNVFQLYENSTNRR